jgi:hypothetical protein
MFGYRKQKGPRHHAPTLSNAPLTTSLDLSDTYLLAVPVAVASRVNS